MLKQHSSTRNLIIFFVIFSLWISVTGVLMLKSAGDQYYTPIDPGQGRLIDDEYAAVYYGGPAKVVVHMGYDNKTYFIPLRSTPEWSAFLTSADNGLIPIMHTPYVPASVCGDGVCQSDENGYDCPGDCGSYACIINQDCPVPAGYIGASCFGARYTCVYPDPMIYCHLTMPDACPGQCLSLTKFGTCRGMQAF